MQETKISLKENPEKIQQEGICDDKEDDNDGKKCCYACNIF